MDCGSRLWTEGPPISPAVRPDAGGERDGSCSQKSHMGYNELKPTGQAAQSIEKEDVQATYHIILVSISASHPSAHSASHRITRPVFMVSYTFYVEL